MQPSGLTLLSMCGALALLCATSRAAQPEFGFGCSGTPAPALAVPHVRSEAKPSSALAPKPYLMAQLGHSGPIKAAAFSPDGRRILTGSADGTARLWDAASGRELRRYDTRSTGILGVAYDHDGREVLAAGSDGAVQRWNAASGEELRRINGHPATAVAFSTQVDRVLLAGSNGIVSVWDTRSGKELRRFQSDEGSIDAAAFSPNGLEVLTGGGSRTARLWNAASGKEVGRLAGHPSSVNAAAWSPDGSRVLTGCSDGTARLWDVKTGMVVERFTTGFRVSSVAFSQDGREILCGSMDGTIRLWDVATGKELQMYRSDGGVVHAVAFSPIARQAVAASNDGTARVLDTASGRVLHRLTGYPARVTAVTLDPGGKHLLTRTSVGVLLHWSMGVQHEPAKLPVTAARAACVALSPDGEHVLTGERDGTVRLWEAAAGKELRRLAGHSREVTAAAFSPDGRFALTGSWDGTARLWDVAAASEVRRFVAVRLPGERAAFGGLVNAVSFSPDAGRIVTGTGSGISLWDAATGTALLHLSTGGRWVNSVELSSDGRRVLATVSDQLVKTEVPAPRKDLVRLPPRGFTPGLWDAGTGKELMHFQGRALEVRAMTFSPDGRQTLTGGEDGVARLWDVGTGRELRRYQGHTAPINAVSFTAAGRRFLTGSDDGTARLWDAGTGDVLCSLTSFQDGGWAVVDPEGRFDASNGGDVEGLHWVLNNEPIELKQLKDGFYEPGLLAKVMGFNPEPLRPVPSLADLRLYPRVAVDPPAPGAQGLTVHLENRGGGIGPVEVYLDGKLAVPDARPRGFDPAQARATVPVELPAEFLAPGREYRVEVVAGNGDESLAGRGVTLALQVPGPAVSRPPHLHVVAAGVSSYANPALNLKLAVRDAAEVTRALALAGRGLFEDRVHLHLLSSDTPAAPVAGEPELPAPRPARKPEFARLFAELRREVQTEDTVVVYLSGHGIAYQRAGKSGYAYLTQDARTTDLASTAFLADHAVSADELAEWLRHVRARKQVVILDTCAAGAAVQRFEEVSARASADQIRALERAKDAAGFHVLMGCAGDKVSWESSQYGQGLLTYALLEGLKGAALNQGGTVEVSPWFDWAERRVPELAREVRLPLQAPLKSQPNGQSFPVGQLTEAARGKIVLRQKRPFLLPPSFFDLDLNAPAEELTAGVRQSLRELEYEWSRGGGQAPAAWYVEVLEHSGALRPGGSIRVENGQATVSLTLQRDGMVVRRGQFGPLPLADRKQDLPVLARRVAQAILHLVRESGTGQ